MAGGARGGARWGGGGGGWGRSEEDRGAAGVVGRAPAARPPWTSKPQAQVRLISGGLVPPRQGELRLGIHFRLAPGWHVYWKNSGDAGFAPAVTWKQVPGLAPPDLLWPGPARY